MEPSGPAALQCGVGVIGVPVNLTPHDFTVGLVLLRKKAAESLPLGEGEAKAAVAQKALVLARCRQLRGGRNEARVDIGWNASRSSQPRQVPPESSFPSASFTVGTFGKAPMRSLEKTANAFTFPASIIGLPSGSDEGTMCTPA